ALVLAACDCGKKPSVDEPAAPVTEATPPVAPAPVTPTTPRMLGKIGARGAFEIVATSEGATLIWAEPGECGRSLHVQRLDADGRKLGEATGFDACAGEPALPSDARILETAAAASNGKLGISWIAQAGAQAQVLGTYGPDDADTLAPVARLSPAAPEHAAERGRLQMVASPAGPIRVAFRAPEADCVGERGRCARLVTQSLPGSAMRVADAREMKAPCSRMLVGAYASQGNWYDAFCALEESAEHEPIATTTVYSLRPEISYAEAMPVLAGCEPLGVAPMGKGVAVLGTCSGVLRAHLVVALQRETILEGVTREAKCSEGRPVLRLVAADGTHGSLTLDEPRDRIELLLPPELAPAGARAAFTGRRVLIASVDTSDQLQLDALTCQGDALVRAPGLL
ncbi:MAG TPA: hypothetical protein VHM19_13910, partial [Polyangiales bacterium]|nr:hypothetical protein [Polyangiales bacterium]